MCSSCRCCPSPSAGRYCGRPPTTAESAAAIAPRREGGGKARLLVDDEAGEGEGFTAFHAGAAFAAVGESDEESDAWAWWCDAGSGDGECGLDLGECFVGEDGVPGADAYGVAVEGGVSGDAGVG